MESCRKDLTELQKRQSSDLNWNPQVEGKRLEELKKIVNNGFLINQPPLTEEELKELRDLQRKQSGGDWDKEKDSQRLLELQKREKYGYFLSEAELKNLELVKNELLQKQTKETLTPEEVRILDIASKIKEEMLP